MSQEDVEVVRRLFEAFNRQDASAVAELWTPDGEWRPAYIGGGQLEGAVFRGLEGVAEFVELQSETWESVLAEPVKMRDLGDTVLVEVHLSALGRGSGVPVDQVTWNVFEVLDGRATSGTAYQQGESPQSGGAGGVVDVAGGDRVARARTPTIREALCRRCLCSMRSTM